MPSPKESPATQYLRELVKRFPDAQALTLAKRAYRERPESWRDVEACRTQVRKILGVQGKYSRKNAADKSLHREPRPAGYIPTPSKRFIWHGPFVIDEPHRTLILSDLQIPFHDVEAVETAIAYGKKRNPTLILLNGDIADHHKFSKFEQDPGERRFKRERRDVIAFLRHLRDQFPKARIILKKGNHEERYERYMAIKCVELLGVPHFRWERVFKLKRLGIELVEHKRPIRLGKLNILHGHEYTFNISSPVNPARGIYMRAKTHCLAGHFHQTSQHSENDLNGNVISCWSTGSLCNLHPQWLPLNKWNHGFAWVETEKDGAFRVDNLRIVNGKVY